MDLNPGPVILDLKGLILTPEESEIIQHPMVGGIIFFKRNYENPQQLMDMVKQIRNVRPQLLLCVDQEGGRVQRFTQGLTKLPPLQSLGRLLEKEPLEKVLLLSEQLGELMAMEIRSLGVDLSFAPVLDVDKGISEIIGDRAFHSDPYIISSLALAYIKGMAKWGMRATGKHFPGHGNVSLDSHLGLPIDERTMYDLEIDLIPFKHLISQRINAIMPAHIVYPNIDPYPVGFSSYWLKTILREKMGFEGTIISDDLDMGGAQAMGDFTTRAQTALNAGCDYVLICNNPKGAIEAIEGIKHVPTALSMKRRLDLLAEGNTPAWHELASNSAWKSALEATSNLN